MNQSTMTLPQRLIATTQLHGAYLLDEGGKLVLYRGDRIPPTLKAGLVEHKQEVLQLLKNQFNGRA